MGWVVFSKKEGEMFRYYDTEQKARAQVTGHNKKLFLDTLRNGHDRYESRCEWAYCAWHDYEEVYKEYYTKNKGNLLARSAWR
jgi:hypothetical protein